MPKHACMYCGAPTKKGRKGEHIIPEVIGGTFTLLQVAQKVVCKACNNGVLSRLDNELCRRSYLAAVASQELERDLWQVWNVDTEAGNLLVDAAPLWNADKSLSALVCFPQIIFDRTGPSYRGDGEEFAVFGAEDAGKVLHKAVRECLGRYCAGEDRALHFERVQPSVVSDGYRFPPRVFTRHTIAEIARNIAKQSFILRFANEGDKRFALNSMSKLDDRRNFRNWLNTPGSYQSRVHIYFDLGDTLRGLMKLGLNLIAAYCKKTPVDSSSFKYAIRVIRGEVQMPIEYLQQNGFVHVEDIRSISGAPKEHTFRLMHSGNSWWVYSSFFGGKVGSFVRIPGPCKEDWVCANIVAPIKSRDWTTEYSSIFQPLLKVRVRWDDSKVLAPSLNLNGTVSSLIGSYDKRQVKPGK